MFDKSLTASVHTFIYPLHRLGFVSSHRVRHKEKWNPILANPPSSVILPTDESGKSGSCVTSLGKDPLLSQANTVGIIGGVSVDSTLKFLRKLAGKQKGDENCVPFVLCSDPVLSKELLSHERNTFPFLSSQSECPPLDPNVIVENLRGKRIFLEKSGARSIVMPCHICHTWYDEVSKGCSVPFMHMGECVAMELKEARLKPLEAGSPLRIGVLGTNATLNAGFYQEKLQRQGFEVVIPDKATIEHTIIPAMDALNRKDMEGARNLLRIALQVLLVRAVNTIVLASDDMRDVLPRDDPLLRKCIDPMDVLAWSTVKWAQSVE